MNDLKDYFLKPEFGFNESGEECIKVEGKWVLLGDPAAFKEKVLFDSAVVIEKLLVENAILREGLANIVVGTLEARKVANETLTAADKVRSK